MNKFYIDMLERLGNMRKDFSDTRYTTHDDLVVPQIKKEFTEWMLTNQHVVAKPDEIPPTVETCKYNSNVMKQFQNIQRLDKEIEEVYLKWKDIKRERLEVQNQLCEQMVQQNGIDFKSSQVFLELCASEVDCEEKPQAVENNEMKETKEKLKCKSAMHTRRDFIKRNVDIAKNMSFPVSLTDEEKIKLDALLKESNIENDEASSDKDVDEESYDCREEEEEYDFNQSPTKLKNEFKFEDNDWDRMSEINEKIKTLSHVEENILDINDVESQLEVDAKLGKNWKYSLLDERLKEIDEQLAKIIQVREAEEEGALTNEELADIDQPTISLESVIVAL